MGIFKVKNDEFLKDKKFVGVLRDDGYVILHMLREKIVLLLSDVEQVEVS